MSDAGGDPGTVSIVVNVRALVVITILWTGCYLLIEALLALNRRWKAQKEDLLGAATFGEVVSQEESSTIRQRKTHIV